jgi:DNA-dependent protein kinase catalytic subunit
MFIRDRFLRNYSLVCLSGYILGIGDRHLENFLLNTRSGEVISIDFGYSFGQAISLMIPELMPFRLSKVFEYAAAPIGLKGIFRHSMINVLKCFR